MKEEEIKALFDEILAKLREVEEGVISNYAYSRDTARLAILRLDVRDDGYRERLAALLQPISDLSPTYSDTITIL